MVYGKFFRKPFSKTRVRLPLESRLSLCSLSFSLCSLLFTVQSHRATPSTPSHLAFSLAQLVPSQPRATSLSLSPISLLAPKPPSYRSHNKGPPSIRRTDLYLTDLILIWSDQILILIWSDLFFFSFFRLIFGICWFSLVNTMIFGNCLFNYIGKHNFTFQVEFLFW